MCSDGSKNNRIPIIMEGETIFHGDGAFPAILGPLDFFYPEGRMMEIGKKQRQFFFECLLNLYGEGFVLFLKPAREAVSGYFSSHFTPSSTD